MASTATNARHGSPLGQWSQSRNYDLILIGLGGSGKYCLMNRLIRGWYMEQYDPCEDWVFYKEFMIDGEVSPINLLRVHDHELEEYLKIGETVICPRKGFLLVYSITGSASFEAIRGYRERIRKAKGDCPMILVGAKSDLAESYGREVSFEEGEALAREFGCPFFETSSYRNENIESPFFELVRLIRRPLREKSSGLVRERTENNASVKDLLKHLIRKYRHHNKSIDKEAS